MLHYSRRPFISDRSCETFILARLASYILYCNRNTCQISLDCWLGSLSRLRYGPVLHAGHPLRGQRQAAAASRLPGGHRRGGWCQHGEGPSFATQNELIFVITVGVLCSQVVGCWWCWTHRCCSVVEVLFDWRLEQFCRCFAGSIFTRY